MNLTNYCTKLALYNYVESFRKALDIRKHDYPLNTKKVCEVLGVKVGELPFETHGLRGMAIKGKQPLKDDVVILNSFRGSYEQNFDCGHEVIHLVRHRAQISQTFQCFEKVGVLQNSFLEWQANEGSAELIIPYKDFIPLFLSEVSSCHDFFDYDALLLELAQIFNVPKTVIVLRIESLKYEINQFERNIHIDNIDVRSNNYQQSSGIVIESYNKKFDYILG